MAKHSGAHGDAGAETAAEADRTEGQRSGGPKFVGAVENAVAILRFLTHSPHPAGVAKVARETGLNVSTAFNILRTLTKEGLVHFDEVSKDYRPGMGLLEFSLPLLGTNQIDLIHPRLEFLSQAHHTLISLWRVTPLDRIVLVDRAVEGTVVRVDMALGSRLPAFVGAIGRCIAATRAINESELRRRFEALRWQRPPNFAQYAADVAAARQDGYAFDRSNLFQGIDIVAAAVVDHEGHARLGISGIAISGQLSETKLDALARALRDTARDISALLYGR